MLESFNDWGGAGIRDSVPGRSPKNHLPGIGLHDPLHGRQACPEIDSFHQGLVNNVPGRGYFRVVPTQNGDKFATFPTSLVERLVREARPSHEFDCLRGAGGGPGGN